MTTCIALLRAVNLGPTNRIAMADLRRLVGGLGLHDPQTLLVSGNVVFGCARAPSPRLEAQLESEVKKSLGLTTEFFVRTREEWEDAIAANPFPNEAAADPGRLILFALKSAPEPAAVAALQKAIKGREVVRARARHAYIVYPDGMGRSKLTIAMIEKALGTRGTARNWNTVLKLSAMARR
jgi:uncharacterized protein (DUF1697 family)